MALPILYGITHSVESGEITARIPKIYKVSIGLPAGPDLHVFINPADRNWTLRWKKQGEKDHKFEYFGVAGVPAPKPTDDDAARQTAKKTADATKAAVKAAYLDRLKYCAKRSHPEKLAYFTFAELGVDNSYYPAWNALEAHGPCPKVVEIVFNDNEPYKSAYQRWGTGKLKCYGNGKTALRSIEFPDPNEREIASKARADGKKWFARGNCAETGCQYARSEDGTKRPDCVAHGSLQFHLVRAPRLGAVSQYDTTGKRSINNLFACLHSILAFTGRGQVENGKLAGIPLRLLIKPFKTVVPGSGKSSTAYAVQLEFPSETMAAMRHRLAQIAREWDGAIAPDTKAIEGGTLPPPPLDMDMEASVMAHEFDAMQQGDGESDSETSSPAGKANSRIEELSRQINGATSTSTTKTAPLDAIPVEDEPEEIQVADAAEQALFDEFSGGPESDDKTKPRKRAARS